MITETQLVKDLQGLGLKPGDTVMLHASVKAVGWVVGGPDVIIQAILDVIGPEGTLMMYAGWEEAPYLTIALEEGRGEAYLAECPAFDPERSRANRKWSILTEYLRTWPGARRSDHPEASVVAVGAKAAWLTKDHPLNYPYGPGSPFAKLCEAGGKVLLLGSPLNAVTVLHYAETIAEIPDKRIVCYRMPTLREGKRVWVEIEDIDTGEGIVEGHSNEEYFAEIVREYLASGKGRWGTVGAASSYLFDAAELVRFAVHWLERSFGGKA
ncbi:aminoglycoside 3-N-acetyltransferase [Candidatus Bipolaricaulota bacterium]|nr:aminoglycoside 3-N-acetyltransferase [Candidatus Bipolaricaulota bacterium]